MIYILMVTCLFFDVMYILCKARKRNVLGLIVKSLAALSFIGIGYLAYTKNNSTFIQLILLGLIFDGLGDFFLAIRNILLKDLMFFIGAVCFLIGHILYIRALFPVANNYQLVCILAGIGAGAFLSALLDNVCHFNKAYKYLGTIYVIMISIMTSLSVGIYFTNLSNANLIFMLGCILFMSSDCILILYNFSKKSSWMHPVYSLLYFIGQILISYSLFLL